MNRSWPTLDMLGLLETGTLEQLHSAFAFLHRLSDTEAQEAFLIALTDRIKELENLA